MNNRLVNKHIYSKRTTAAQSAQDEDILSALAYPSHAEIFAQDGAPTIAQAHFVDRA